MESIKVKSKGLIPTHVLILGIILGVLMIGCGIVCFCVPGTGYAALCYAIGAVILVIGVLELIGFFRYWKGILGGSWVIANAILTIIFGLFLLFNETAVEAILPFIAGIYIIVLGFVRLFGSTDLAALHLPNWWVEMVNGILGIVLGVVFCFLPLSGAMTMVICMGILLIIGGLGVISDAIFFFKMKRFKKQFMPLD
ncbi:MAG: DUF308 domain-containing protein [Bacilli bacterium]|nr:DUF308 domain-containing protein [Bacilli bacterium]